MRINRKNENFIPVKPQYLAQYQVHTRTKMEMVNTENIKKDPPRYWRDLGSPFTEIPNQTRSDLTNSPSSVFPIYSRPPLLQFIVY